MAKAYFLNTISTQIWLSINGGPPQSLLSFDPAEPKQDMVLSYELVQAVNPGADKIGSTTLAQVTAPSKELNINYKVNIVVDTNTTPLTDDLEFLIFADGIIGRQGNLFGGVKVQQA